MQLSIKSLVEDKNPPVIAFLVRTGIDHTRQLLRSRKRPNYRNAGDAIHSRSSPHLKKASFIHFKVMRLCPITFTTPSLTVSSSSFS
jgi:hypothetical protein